MICTITAYDNIIMGGTGRYQYASGSFDALGRQDLGNSDEPVITEGWTVFTFKGTISFHTIPPTPGESRPHSSDL